MKDMFEKIKNSFFSILLPGFFIVVMILNVIVSFVGIDTIMKIPSDIVDLGIVVKTETETETIEKEITEKTQTIPVDKLPNKSVKKVTTVTRKVPEDFSKSILDWGVAGTLFILFCLSYLIGNIIRAIAVDFFDITIRFPLFCGSYWNTIIHKSKFPYPMMLFALASQMKHKPGIKGILDEISNGVKEKYAPIIALQKNIIAVKKERDKRKKNTTLDHITKKREVAALNEKLSGQKKELKKVLKMLKKDMKEWIIILHNRFNYCKMYLCHRSFTLFTFIRECEEQVRLFAGMCWAGLIGVLANFISLIIMAVTGFTGLWIVTILLLCISVLLFTIFINRIRPTRAVEAKRVYLGYALVKAGEKNEKKSG